MNTEMRLNPVDYIHQFNYFDNLRNYIADHIDFYQYYRKTPLSLPISDDELAVFLRQGNKELLGTAKENDTFRNFVNNLRKHPASTVSRDNLMRLCFVLGIRTIEDANDFFTNYMHSTVLSARNLKEFIVLAGLKLKMTWEEVCELFADYDEQLARQQREQNAPGSLDEYSDRTNFLFNTIIRRFHSRHDLESYLQQESNLNYFATTRNTIYLRLFDDLILEERKDSVILIEEDKRYPVQNYYLRLFGLCSLDEIMYLKDGVTMADNFLSENEISSLGVYFPDVFMSYDVFANVVNRTRTVDISYGTYLLHLLMTAENVDTSAREDASRVSEIYQDMHELILDYGLDFREPQELFDHYLNHSLIQVGFPELSEEAGFDRLIMDTYDEVMAYSNSETTSQEIQIAFLHNLRSYLKQIAAIKPAAVKVHKV